MVRARGLFAQTGRAARGGVASNGTGWMGIKKLSLSHSLSPCCPLHVGVEAEIVDRGHAVTMPFCQARIALLEVWRLSVAQC